MKTVWIAGLARCDARAPRSPRSTIYKHVDDERPRHVHEQADEGRDGGWSSSRSRRFPRRRRSALLAGSPRRTAVATLERRTTSRQSATVDARLAPLRRPIDRDRSQKRRDNDRRKILEDELTREEESLDDARKLDPRRSSRTPRWSPRCARRRQTADPTPRSWSRFRNNIDKASGRIRGLQATVAEHEKNIEALKKELGALEALASSSLPFRHHRSADAPAASAGALVAFLVVRAT